MKRCMNGFVSMDMDYYEQAKGSEFDAEQRREVHHYTGWVCLSFQFSRIVVTNTCRMKVALTKLKIQMFYTYCTCFYVMV